MNTEEYSSLCKQRDAFSKGSLDATRYALKGTHAPSFERLTEILDGNPVEKPELHTGDKYTDYFKVELNTAQAEQIVEHLIDLEAEAVGPDGETTSKASMYSDLVNAWVNYVELSDENLG